MGRQEWAVAQLPPLILEDLVPPEHFHRHLERSLDLRFVSDLVRHAYAETGRPALDPVAFFKLRSCRLSCSSQTWARSGR